MDILQKPIQTQAVVADWADGAFRNPHTTNAEIAPQGNGGVAKEYGIQPGHTLKLAFEVSDHNQKTSNFAIVSSRDGTSKALFRAVITDASGKEYFRADASKVQPGQRNPLGSEQPFGHYCSANTKEQVPGVTLKLPNGRYYIWLDAPVNDHGVADGAQKCPLLHQEGNTVVR